MSLNNTLADFDEKLLQQPYTDINPLMYPRFTKKILG